MFIAPDLAEKGGRSRRAHSGHTVGEANPDAAAATKIQSVWRGTKQRSNWSGEQTRRQQDLEEWIQRVENEQKGGAMTYQASATNLGTAKSSTAEPQRSAAGWHEEDVEQDLSQMMMELNLRQQIHLLMEDQNSSRVALGISLFVLSVIVLSILFFMLETMPELYYLSAETWYGMEAFCSIVFTVEYVVRLAVCDAFDPARHVIHFVTQPMNVCDLLAISPFYIDLAMKVQGDVEKGAGLNLLKVARLIRLLRIFKLGRYSAGMQLMWETLRNSFQALWSLVFFIVIALILFSSVVYYVEKGSCPRQTTMGPDDLAKYLEECDASGGKNISPTYGLCCDRYESPLDFPSIFAAFWWCIVTMTTVGFGDVYPKTGGGKVVGVAAMLTGILLIALPVAIVGRKFQEVYDLRQNGKRQSESRGDLRSGISGSSSRLSQKFGSGGSASMMNFRAGESQSQAVEELPERVVYAKKLGHCKLKDSNELTSVMSELAALLMEGEKVHNGLVLNAMAQRGHYEDQFSGIKGVIEAM